MVRARHRIYESSRSVAVDDERAVLFACPTTDSRDAPEPLLLVGVAAGVELGRPETLHAPHKLLARPAEALVRRVAEAKDGEGRVVEEAAGEVGAEEQLPQLDHRPRLSARARRREDEEDARLVDQIVLGQLSGKKNNVRSILESQLTRG
jgi:hypothetical protein